MMLIENRNFLRIHQRSLLDELTKWEKKEYETVEIEASRMGKMTAKLLAEGKSLYVHSKYDPETEAAKLIEQLEGLQGYNHIIFIGTGLGYHIKALLMKYPNMSFSIYEPNKEMLYQFLCYQDVSGFPKATLKKIITESSKDALKKEIVQLHLTMNAKPYIFTLPSCEKLYEKEQKVVLEAVKEQLKNKRGSMATNFSFQKRWTVNSIKNFSEIVQTPNILHDVNLSAFKDKPAIIAAAGPSLSEEFEHLRYIKENGLAYIFSVGSAINALIEQGIYPDAACTYDPQGHNVRVIEIISKKGIKDIPLVFGSSVGFETLRNYPGPKLHMITNQDTVSPYYLKDYGELKVVLDAPTIAVITFQLLKMLGCGPIILTGQNLGFKDNKRYADGISYENLSNELSEREVKSLVEVRGVQGEKVYANESFIKMREQFEMYIRSCEGLEVINTTKNGAHIEGTSFMSMQEVIEKRLSTNNTLTEDWFATNNQYNVQQIMFQKKQMRLHKKRLNEGLENMLKEIRKIDANVKSNKTVHLENNFNKLDKEFNYVRSNSFFKAFIEPMIRIHMERLQQDTQSIRFEKNLHKKGAEIARIFAGFLMDCKGPIHSLVPYINELDQKIEELSEIETIK